jgi:lycopene cyclase domain-containing protein
MFWEYSLYILCIILGTALVNVIFRLNPVRRMKLLVSSVLPVAVIFVAWDVFAVYSVFWSFNLGHMLGLIFINQPIEEIGFFLTVPFYYVTIWELVKKFLGDTR